MPTLDVEGTRLRYEIQGPEGAPWLVFSNSLGTNLSMWDGQVAAFENEFRILRYDARGHGGSDAPDGPYTIDRLGQDTLALMDALGVERAGFCGLSMGGMVGMWLGTKAPERLDRLVLANTAAHMPPTDLWDGRIRTVTEKGMDALTEQVIERWFSPDFRASHRDRIAPVREMLLATPRQGYAACCAAIRDMDQREIIRSVHTPTLVIAGAHDPATPPDKAEEIVGAIPGAELVVLEAAHLSNIEAEAEFTATLRRFLQR